MVRPKLEPGGGAYFTAPSASHRFISSGCALLDCALGGGYPLGRVVNIVGDKCLSGDTIVSAQRGTKPRKMTLRDLFNRVKGDHWNRNSDCDTYLLADVGGYVGMAKVLDVVSSGEKVLYEITNERGAIIKASKDHKFATVEGWMCLEDGLRTGTLVKGWHGTRSKEVREHVRKDRSYTYSIPFHPFGQRNIVAGRDYKRLLTARVVVDAAINGLELQEFIRILRNDPTAAAALQYTDPELQVHHLDGDPTNDALDNIRLVSAEEHWEIHADEMAPSVKSVDVCEIVSIRKVGVEPTFDVTMEGPHHNFVANGFVVHNSTGKTLLAIEACANLIATYPKARIWYLEAESAFDRAYAEALGFPVDHVKFVQKSTVEGLFTHLSKIVETDNSEPGLYIVDSLDALSDEAEMGREITDGSYGAQKAKKMSELFRRLVRQLEHSSICLIIISQVRDAIGVRFGVKHSRTGGRALDFYASQVMFLAQIGTLKKTIRKVERKTGIEVRAKVTKNKIGLPLREAEFSILFGFGVDDIAANLQWLSLIGKGQVPKDTERMSNEQLAAYRAQLADAVRSKWSEVEQSFLPKRKKYG